MQNKSTSVEVRLTAITVPSYDQFISGRSKSNALFGTVRGVRCSSIGDGSGAVVSSEIRRHPMFRVLRERRRNSGLLKKTMSC